ncbi:hypothetical protein [Eggerthella sinensis]|uniref:hypothetical protein n=1 Tax=Eggerthella sinensis TaxID=242230 RepID=UPI00266DB3F6|nr:hypothetical protein [Eggerthella sinensis]
MGSRLEGTKKETSDLKKEYGETSSRSREITESRKKTLEGLSGIDSMDEEVTEALRVADREVKTDAKTDFRTRVEALMEKIGSDVGNTQGKIAESVNESRANKSKIESVAGRSDYGSSGIRSAESRVEQMGRSYSDMGRDLGQASDAARRDMSQRKREIDS